ncbi:MAG: lipoyl(octanoyl) transferase LipB [Candidatus Omnitrophota bacterium]|nr:lipoyl(octanoyl) transferase LipB [Candidatus Omnitrophota bacterium]
MNFEAYDLGLIDFGAARKKQLEVFVEVKNRRISSALIFCRHYPVITLGRRTDIRNILASEKELIDKKISVLRVERGGDATYHGPGQLTVYPIFNLNFLKKDIHWFLRQLESALIKSLSGLGISAVCLPGLTGVWVNKEKIASIGIAVRNWVTFHGFSLNVEESDTRNFRLIRPCGMDIKMTSIEAALGKKIEFDALRSSLKKEVALCMT